jgi:hypothetical protein
MIHNIELLEYIKRIDVFGRVVQNKNSSHSFHVMLVDKIESYTPNKVKKSKFFAQPLPLPFVPLERCE